MSEQTVASTITARDFRKEFLAIWKELFEPTEGPHYLLDGGDSFFETLAGITAEEANVPVSKQSANLAAQVQHTAFYVDALRQGLATNWTYKADWAGSWTIDPVDDVRWQALIGDLRDAYAWVTAFASDNEDWNADYVGGAFALACHAAYHLGEVRQGIGVIRSRE